MLDRYIDPAHYNYKSVQTKKSSDALCKNAALRKWFWFHTSCSQVLSGRWSCKFDYSFGACF